MLLQKNNKEFKKHLETIPTNKQKDTLKTMQERQEKKKGCINFRAAFLSIVKQIGKESQQTGLIFSRFFDNCFEIHKYWNAKS